MFRGSAQRARFVICGLQVELAQQAAAALRRAADSSPVASPTAEDVASGNPDVAAAAAAAAVAASGAAVPVGAVTGWSYVERHERCARRRRRRPITARPNVSAASPIRRGGGG